MSGLTHRDRVILKAMSQDPVSEEKEIPWRTVEEVTGLLPDEFDGYTRIPHHLDRLERFGYLEKRESPSIQYRRVWKSRPWDVDQVRAIQQRRTADTVMSGKAEEGVVLVDQITATLLMAVHDNVNEKNKQKLVVMDVIDAVGLCWKLHERGAISMGVRAA